MNQQNFYELQFNGQDIKIEYPMALVGRDKFVVKCVEKFNLKTSGRVAELSIGDGRLTHLLLKTFPRLSLDCFDISSSRIQNVKEFLKDSLMLFNTSQFNFIECNFDTQFQIVKSSEYQVVIALDIMEHVFDIFGFLEHCKRILDENGLLILRVPNIAYIRHRIALMFGSLPITASWFGPKQDLTAWAKCYGWDGGHLHSFTLPILYKLLERSGFRVEICRDSGARFEKLRNIAPRLLYANPLIVARKI